MGAEVGGVGWMIPVPVDLTRHLTSARGSEPMQCKDPTLEKYNDT